MCSTRRETFPSALFIPSKMGKCEDCVIFSDGVCVDCRTRTRHIKIFGAKVNYSKQKPQNKKGHRLTYFFLKKNKNVLFYTRNGRNRYLTKESHLSPTEQLKDTDTKEKRVHHFHIRNLR